MEIVLVLWMALSILLIIIQMDDKRGDDVVVAYPLFQEGCGGSIPTSPLQLKFFECSIRTAIELNKQWHSVLPNVIYSNIQRNKRKECFTAEFDGVFYATAIWTCPIAGNRISNGYNMLELRRFAICKNAPPNTASRMLSWMVKKIRKKYPQLVRLISYQDTEKHKGTIYKACGWEPSESKKHNAFWSMNGRIRNKEQSLSKKIRWELNLTR